MSIITLCSNEVQPIFEFNLHRLKVGNKERGLRFKLKIQQI